MSPRTLFLSKLIGLYCVLIGLSMMTRGQATVETVTALLQNSAMTLILGVITLAAGLAMVLAHNIWSGPALTVIVTLVGWMALIKSLFFLFLPHEMEAGLFLGHYVAYLVTEELVGSNAKDGYDDECFTGKLLRSYSKSHFLAHVARDTGGHIEPIQHYKLVCLNHLIDVAACAPPEVRVLASGSDTQARIQ